MALANNLQNQPSSLNPPLRQAMAAEGERISEYLVDHPGSRSALAAAILLSLYVAYHLFFMTLFMDIDFLYAAPLVSVLQVLLFTNKEHIEHLSSHAGGSVVRAKNAKRLADWIIVGGSLLRTFLVWPLQLWMPHYYYCTHAGIHHVEDNGPADFQSTLRYDKTSFVDFVKAVTWYSLFINLLPIDILRYFVALGRRQLLRRYLRGLLIGASVFGVVTWLHPVLGMVVLITHIASGMDNYLILMRWHGFHDAEHPHSVEASNNSPRHYLHHLQPAIHLTVQEGSVHELWNSKREQPQLATFVSASALDIYTRNSMLIFFMLWQRKYAAVQSLLSRPACDRIETQLRGLGLAPKSAMLQRIDERLSQWIGSREEARHAKYLSQDDRIALVDAPRRPADGGPGRVPALF